MPQKGVLFSGTIDINLKFAGEHITDEDVQHGRRHRPGHGVHRCQARGLSTSPIAQGGSNVSGGQKQRLSIARAIAKQPQHLSV